MWFYCRGAPEIAQSPKTRALTNVWWKSSHPLVLEEDPGNPLVCHALKYLSNLRHAEDLEGQVTASLSKALSQGTPITLQDHLSNLLTEVDLEVPSDDDEINDDFQAYGMQVLDVGALARTYATIPSNNKRKSSVLDLNQMCQEQQEHVPAHMQELADVPTFQEMGATGIQCAWCEKWRFVCANIHTVPEESEDDGSTTFECHQLEWCDGTPVGMSCESYEQDFRAPNPKDTFAKDKGFAEGETKKIFEWWNLTSGNDTPVVTEETNMDFFREHYWEYLAHMGTLVPEGFADHPMHTLKVEDLGK